MKVCVSALDNGVVYPVVMVVALSNGSLVSLRAMLHLLTHHMHQ